jgi:pimeloyl-ACP methyl ester carboxylesterase
MKLITTTTLFVLLFLAVAASLPGQTAAVRAAPSVRAEDNTTQQIQYHLDYIRSRGYPAEYHTVTTADGYILSVFRIPHGRSQSSNNKKKAVLWHGLLGSSFSFVTNNADQSLSYRMADAGYDVYLPNSRGNTFSRKNTHYDIDDAKFWDFSWDEQVAFDMPAVYDYVLKGEPANATLVYVGHSQGTTQMFGALTRPDVSKLIQPRTSAYVALAPVAYIGHQESALLKDLAKWGFAQMLEKLGVKEFVPDESILHKYDPELCAQNAAFCNSLLVAVSGCSLKHKNVTAMANYLRIQPAGTSIKNIIHWMQEIGSGNYEMFDYGSESGNMAHYNQTTPPQYDLSKYDFPPQTLFFTGGRDNLANPVDVKHLMDILSEAGKDKPKNQMPQVTFVEDFDHLDFTIAIDANKYVYEVILQSLP